MLTRRAFARAGLSAGAGLAAGGCGPLRRALASAERRNVVLIVIDSLRADHLGCYGARAMRTPNLDELARGATRFTSVFPEAMPTVPARRSLMSGRRAYPFRGWQPWAGMAKRPGWEPIRPGADTLVSAFRRAGWWTAYVTDNPFLGYTGVFEPFRRSPDRFVRIEGQRGERRPRTSVPRSAALKRLPPGPLRRESRIRSLQQYLANNGGTRDERQQAAARVFRSAAALLRTAKRQGRFLMVVDCFDPHEPWTPPRRYLDMYGDPDYDGYEISDVGYTRASNYLSKRQIGRLRTTYKASVTMTDRWLGEFLETLWDLRLEDSTAILLVSDHGVLLGEHDWTGKGPGLLHPELIHVPMLLREPGGAGVGAVSDWFASTHDVAPTLAALAGVRAPASFEGADLSPILTGRSPDEARPYAVGGYGNNSYVRGRRWAYMTKNDGREERLYDLATDRAERHNLAAKRRDVTAEMRRRVRGAAGGRPPFYPEREMLAAPREGFGRSSAG
jgi:arylsulfatase A-like enzyme